MEVKSVGTFPTITVKLATSPLFSKTSRVMSLFLGTNAAVLGGWERDDPAKGDQVVVIMSG